jgi:ubiquinone/menaquinone biosynthesis C-methylase UbiE
MASIDLGCGDNKVNPYFIGVDKRLTEATNIVTDADDLSPFSDGSVNIVFSRRCIQHVADDIAVFREINRVLTPNGIAVIEVASFYNAITSKLLNRLGIKKHPYEVFHVYTRNALKRKLEASGLKIVSLSLSPTETPLFRNHVAVCMKGQNTGLDKEPKLSNQ